MDDPGLCYQPRRRSIDFDTLLSCTREEASKLSGLVLNPKDNIQDSRLVNLAWGPKRKLESWPIYIINGYKFQTVSWNEGMNSSNYGVHVRGTDGQLESDFYGMLYDIIQLEYTGIPLMKLVLFKCD
ncbi:hypothetical protein JHK85_025525 [Glycine max]|nr:hypothetical protein JHK85_025525 [Glycine max]